MARILCTFAGGHGHLLPMLPLARALRARGHQLAVTGNPAAVADHGVFEAVFPHASVEGQSPNDAARGTGTLVAPDLAHELSVIGRWFAGTLAERNAQHTGDLIASWRPDLLVCDEMDFGSIVAAESAGLPAVVVTVIVSGGLTRRAYVAAPLAALRDRHHLAPDPHLTRLWGDLVVSPGPTSLRDPAFPLPTGAIGMRPDDLGVPGALHPAAAWLADSPAPGVLVTLGTVFNIVSGDLFSRILDAVPALGVRVLATVGHEVDPGALTAVGSPDVRIEQWVPQAQVMPSVGAVVSHGGSGSVLGALSHGVPVVALPLGADQELNAARLEYLGAGAVLSAVDATAAQIATAVSAALSGAGRAGAQSVQRELADRPSASVAAGAVEALLG